MASANIIDSNTTMMGDSLQCTDMGSSKIAHMDIVTNSRSIWRWIIVTKNA